MKFKLLIALTLGLAATAASAEPFANGNPHAGRPLADKSCNACHVSMFGGDGSKIYTRPDRKVKSAEQLAARIRACNANSGAGWFPEEEAHVAAYLNATYYHFK